MSIGEVSENKTHYRYSKKKK